MDIIAKASYQLRKGGIILIYDGDDREGEADMVFSASFADADKIELLRKDAGGLICAAITKKCAEKLCLPFFSDLLEGTNNQLSGLICKKTAYGDKPAFSIPINHRNVYTGITDEDRALTLTKLDEVLGNGIHEFPKEFYSPGHIFLLIGSGLENRRGHTELALELGKRAGLNGAMVLCEMLGKRRALSKEGARSYAEKHGFVFIEGKEII